MPGSLAGLQYGDPVVLSVPEHGWAQGYYVRPVGRPDVFGSPQHFVSVHKRAGKLKPHRLIVLPETQLRRGWKA